MASKRGGKRNCDRAVLVLLSVLLAVATAHGGKAPKAPPKPTNDECLVCHGDAGLSTERDGKPVSLAVNPDAFKTSMHGSILTCVDCHADVATSPHEKTPAKVSCATCHADQQAAYDRSNLGDIGCKTRLPPPGDPC